MTLKELEREGTRRLKRHRGIRWESYQALVQEETNCYADAEWALSQKEERQLAPDLVTTFTPRAERVKSMVLSWMP